MCQLVSIRLIVVLAGLIILESQIWGSYTLLRNVFRVLALAPPLMLLVMRMTNNRGNHGQPRQWQSINVPGWITTITIFAASVATRH